MYFHSWSELEKEESGEWFGSRFVDINDRENTENEIWKSMPVRDFVIFTGNLKKWKKILYAVVVKLQKIGYTKDTDFLGCSIALLF